MSHASPSGHRVRSLAVPWPALLVAGLMVALLLAVSAQYGFHGDEMYYVVAGQHPAFGYVDQPPLTPLLSAASVALLGVSPTAVRVLPALEMALIVVLVALMARDLGGSRRAQVLAAITAALSGYLGAGHLDTTTDPDLLAWAIILWLLVKLLAGGDRRLWLVVGVVTGIGLENKDTLLFLGADWRSGSPLPALGRRALAVGMVGDRDRTAALGAEPRLASGERLAAAQHGAGHRRVRGRQPRPGRSAALAVQRAAAFPGERRGPGLDAAAKAAARWRAIGITALVALLLVFVSGGKAYYAIGSASVFMAAGRSFWTAGWPGATSASSSRASGRPPCCPAPSSPTSRCRSCRLPRSPRRRSPRPSRTRPTRSAGRSSSRRWKGSSPRCPRTSAPTP